MVILFHFYVKTEYFKKVFTLMRPSFIPLLPPREHYRSSFNCRCGAEEQTADNILASCPLYYAPNETLGLAVLDNDTVDWLQTTVPCIWWNNCPKRRRRRSFIPI